MSSLLRRYAFTAPAVLAMWVISALRWPALPEQVPIHWNLEGQIDGWGPKAVGLLLAPVIGTLAALLADLGARRSPALSRSAGFPLIIDGLVAFFLVVHVATLWQLDVPRLIGVSAGLLFVLLGLAMPLLEPNPWAGVRTPWTLLSRRSWEETHRLAGKVFVVHGLLVFLSAFAGPVVMAAVLLGGLALGMPWLVWRSWRSWAADPGRVEPGGGSPAR